MEEVQARHRKEQRDLQSCITQKKKQASKKRRKGVNEECDKLEAELKEKQQAEIATLNSEQRNNEEVHQQLDDLTLTVDDEESADTAGMTNSEDLEVNGTALPNGEETKVGQPKKPNRQKARLARRAAERVELAREAAEEAKNLPDLRQQERDRILEYMKERGLQEKEIRADGHCLYSAVADQLEQLQIPLGAAPDDNPSVPVYITVRSAAADYIQSHKDDFVPFLEEPLDEYLRKVRDTGEWGGQLELMALAKAYKADISVLQDFGRVEKIEIGGNDDTKVMWLVYYKHGFGLGEHYNSLRNAH